MKHIAKILGTDRSKNFDDKALGNYLIEQGLSQELSGSILGIVAEVSQNAWTNGRQDILENYERKDTELIKRFKQLHQEAEAPTSVPSFIDFCLDYLSANIDDIQEILEEEDE